MNDRGNQIITGIVVAFLVIGAWYLGRTQNVPAMTPGTGTSTAASGTSSIPSAGGTIKKQTTANQGAPSKVESGDSVVVSNQPAGSSVSVASATLAQAGWVAIRDDSGRVLGAAFLSVGTQANASVPLLRDTVSGGHYQVLIYVDNGDHTFDLHADTLVLNADGSVAGTAFTAQ